MTSPFIETYGLTEEDFDEIKEINQLLHTMSKLHPEIQDAILNRTNANVEGDHYKATLSVLSGLGFTKDRDLSFKDRNIKGTRYSDKTHIVEVSTADFLGKFTDIQFKRK